MLKEDKLAEEWLDKRYLKDMGVRKPCKEAFLAGLKAGKEMAETDLAIVAYMQGAESGYNKAFVEADKNLKAIVTGFNKARELIEELSSSLSVVGECEKEISENEPCHSNYRIRENGGEWHEPLVEVEE